MFCPALVGLVDLGENKRFGIVETDDVDHPLRCMPGERGAGDETRFHKSGTDRNILFGSFGDVAYYMDAVTKFLK